MARIGFKGGHEYQQVGEVILAAWFKVLGDNEMGGSLTLEDLRPEITAAINDILDNDSGNIDIKIWFDTRAAPPAKSVVNVAIPLWPEKVQDIAGLIGYLQTYHDKTSGRHFNEELGNAIIFGCGK